MGDQSQIHRLLDRVARQEGEAGLTDGHDVAVVSEDGQPLAGQGACRYVENGGGQLPGDLVHCGDHQEEALGSRERGRESPGLKGSVYGRGGAALALHLLDERNGSPEVLPAPGGPLVGILSHGA